MFPANVYQRRRNSLRKKIGSGILLFPGNVESAMNYPANPYPFRQDSNFLYFFGIDKPGFTGLIDADSGEDYLFGEDFAIDDIIWMGPQPRVNELGKMSGVHASGSTEQLDKKLAQAVAGNRSVHYLPVYRQETAKQTGRWLGIETDFVNTYASRELVRHVVDLRSYKDDLEVGEIEKALEISAQMYETALKMIRPGVVENEVAGALHGIVAAAGSLTSFPTILSVHGETLHNHFHGNIMQDGDLLVIDSGAESPEHYASDITRTFPVNGRFSSIQRDVYEIVLQAQMEAIDAIRPGVFYRDIHLQSALTITRGLKDLGLIKGNPEDAVKEGAHALFFPHGLGHMMGLDVHDMEGLGEDSVGYTPSLERSSQFGLAYLRMARELEPGFVLTVEPGIYFIPALIDLWKKENRFSDFIDFNKTEEFRGFGGIRIEDDVLVTSSGKRVLGHPIPKSVEDIEKKMA